MTPVSPAKVLMAGDAAEHEAEPDARLDAEAVFDLDGLKSDVVGVFQHRDRAGAVEADIELARDAVERAVVENVEMPFARVRPGVDQLLRIDAGGRRAGDVADIVGAGAARAQAEILNASSIATAFFGSTSRICRLARVVTWA